MEEKRRQEKVKQDEKRISYSLSLNWSLVLNSTSIDKPPIIKSTPRSSYSHDSVSAPSRVSMERARNGRGEHQIV